MKSKFYICRHCGNLITMVHDAGVPVVCCGEKMQELVPDAPELIIQVLRRRKKAAGFAPCRLVRMLLAAYLSRPVFSFWRTYQSVPSVSSTISPSPEYSRGSSRLLA